MMSTKCDGLLGQDWTLNSTICTCFSRVAWQVLVPLSELLGCRLNDLWDSTIAVVRCTKDLGAKWTAAWIAAKWITKSAVELRLNASHRLPVIRITSQDQGWCHGAMVSIGCCFHDGAQTWPFEAGPLGHFKENMGTKAGSPTSGFRLSGQMHLSRRHQRLGD